MPSPGAGSVTSLSYMAQFLRSKNNNPSQGYSAGAEHRDVTLYQQTFQRPGSIFGPGYPLVPPSRQPIRGWDYPVSWNTNFRPRSYEPIGFGEMRSLAERHTLTSLAIGWSTGRVDKHCDNADYAEPVLVPSSARYQDYTGRATR